MAEKIREQNQNDQFRDHPEKERQSGNVPQQPRINKVADDLDEKSSTMGRNDRSRSGLSTKDGLTGSDLDGQVTR